MTGGQLRSLDAGQTVQLVLADSAPPPVFVYKHRIIHSRGAKACRLLKDGTFWWPFFALGNARAQISVGLRKRDGNISVDLSLFDKLYITIFMNKLKFIDNKNKMKKKIHWLFNFFQPTKSPNFPHRGKVGQLRKGREHFVGLSILLVYEYKHHWSSVQYK